MRAFSAWVVCAMAMAIAAPAAAQPSPQAAADAKHAEALAASDRGQLEEAVVLFKQAIALEASPKYECNLGYALSLLGENARTHAILTRCVPRLAAVSPDNVASYRELLNRLEAGLRTTHVAVDVATSPANATVSISTWPGDETVVAPTVIWLPAGGHELIARLPGHDDATLPVEVTASDVSAALREKIRITLTATAVTDPDPRRDPPPTTAAPRSRKPAYIALGVGGALLAGGAVVHVLSIPVRDELAGLSDPEYSDKLPTWHAYQYSTIGLYAAGAVATGLGVYLYTRAGTPAPIAVTPTADGAGAMIWLLE